MAALEAATQPRRVCAAESGQRSIVGESLVARTRAHWVAGSSPAMTRWGLVGAASDAKYESWSKVWRNKPIIYRHISSQFRKLAILRLIVQAVQHDLV
jgi:hypothetical protein